MNHILIVEDDYNSRILITKILEYYEYIVYTAEDGESGVSKAKEKNPDVIFMDIRLPGISGIEAIKQIREYEKQEKLTNTPIIVISAFLTETLIKECEGLNVDAFLNKPYNLSSIKDSLLKALTNIVKKIDK